MNVGPSYASIFMGYFEYLLLQQYNKLMPETYKRYNDDIIGTTSINCNQLLDFINFVQNFHSAVKFTYQTSETFVSFLDMNISLKQEILSTSSHYKTTDFHSYLDYHSPHNPRTKNSIPFSQFLRLCRMCSDDADFQEKGDGLTYFFINRHFPNNIIKLTLDLVKLMVRWVVGSILHGVDPLSYFSVQSVLHDW